MPQSSHETQSLLFFGYRPVAPPVRGLVHARRQSYRLTPAVEPTETATSAVPARSLPSALGGSNSSRED
jgi:hypothetical protein